mgnify:CR=1 FL=1
MAKKKTDEPKVYKEHPSVDQRITDTLRENYMAVRDERYRIPRDPGD